MTSGFDGFWRDTVLAMETSSISFKNPNTLDPLTLSAMALTEWTFFRVDGTHGFVRRRNLSLRDVHTLSYESLRAVCDMVGETLAH